MTTNVDKLGKMDSKMDKAMVCDTPTDQSVAAADDKVEWDVGQEQRAKRK